jgi:hypothetical protein
VRAAVAYAVVVGALGACTLLVDTSDLAGTRADDGGPPADVGVVESPAPPPDGPPEEAAPADAATLDAPADRSTPAYRSAVLADLPLAYWRMGISSGTDVPDETGTSNVLTLHACALGEPGGIANDPDTSVRFNGTNAYATAKDARPFDFPTGHPFTLEIWARFDPLDAGDTYGELMSNFEQLDATAKDRNGYLFYLAKLQDPPLVGLEWDPDGEQHVTNKIAAPLHSWGHYVGVFDGAKIVAYLNGVAGGPTAVATGLITTRTSPFVVGAIGPSTSRFAGALDEVAVYDKALTSVQIAAHYHAGIGQ